MMRIQRLLIISLLLFSGYVQGQTLQQKLSAAVSRLQADSQCTYASISLTVLDVKTRQQVFAVNPNMGLATASTLKTITTITAFNVLGADFKYQTQFGYSGSISNGVLTGDIIIKGSGDPTLGSSRYESIKENHVLNQFVDAIKKAGIKKIVGRVIGDDSIFGSQSIPDGWIWQDVGNYYGAGTSGLCWRENEYEIKLHTGAIGKPVGIAYTVPAMPYLSFRSELLNAPALTGDKSYAYLPIDSKEVYLRGTYAIDQAKKSISVALPDPAYDAAFRLADTLNRLGIIVTGDAQSTQTLTAMGQQVPVISQNLTVIESPELSKIVYWANQKSINLYAEQLLKTIAWKAGKEPLTANGVTVLQDFWKARGIDPNSLNLYDGSGLSPGDRVTTHTLATILQSATTAPWFADFMASLPVYNNIKMKSGSINDVLNYAGYQTYDGRQLCFSIMVNNFNGSTKGIKEKIFKVLDELK